MAIAYVNSADGELASGTTLTLSSYVIASGDDKLLLVGVEDNSSVGITSVTWNTSESLTQLVSQGTLTGTRYVYGLLNPTATTANIVITYAGTTAGYAGAANYTGVKQTGFPDDTASASITSGVNTQADLSFTTLLDDCWSFCITEGDNGSVAGVTNATERQQDSLDRKAIFDSNGSLGFAGAKTMSTSCALNSNGGSAGITFAPSTLNVVAYNSSGSAQTASNVTSLSTSVTNTSGTYLVAWLAVNTTSATNLAMTYNGVSLTQVDTQSANTWTMAIFTLANPATGSNLLEGTWTTADHAIIGMATFTGVGSVGSVNKGTSAAGTTSVSVTSTLGASDMLAGGIAYNSTAANLAVSVGAQRSEQGDTPTSGVATNTGTGSVSITWTRGGSATAAYMGIPLIASSGVANVKTVNGLAIASVKTVDDLAIASVKTINGLN